MSEPEPFIRDFGFVDQEKASSTLQATFFAALLFFLVVGGEVLFPTPKTNPDLAHSGPVYTAKDIPGFLSQLVPGSSQQLDYLLYTPGRGPIPPNSPVIVFLHGAYATQDEIKLRASSLPKMLVSQSLPLFESLKQGLEVGSRPFPFAMLFPLLVDHDWTFAKNFRKVNNLLDRLIFVQNHMGVDREKVWLFGEGEGCHGAFRLVMQDRLREGVSGGSSRWSGVGSGGSVNKGLGGGFFDRPGLQGATAMHFRGLVCASGYVDPQYPKNPKLLEDRAEELQGQAIRDKLWMTLGYAATK